MGSVFSALGVKDDDGYGLLLLGELFGDGVKVVLDGIVGDVVKVMTTHYDAYVLDCMLVFLVDFSGRWCL